jgi:hypothetical protein
MKKSANVCVVIPLYKTQPSDLERKSVEQARKIFAGRDIFYVVPVGFDSSAYGFEAPVEFPAYYFQSLVNYSELCCLHDFYQAFKDYEYMLIYQPDCWVFEDKLDEFCALGFDYIGAPWSKMRGIEEDGVGNGGFCLRRVSKFMDLTKQLRSCGCHPEDRFWCIMMKDYLNIAPLKVAAHFSLEHDPARWFNAYGKKRPMGCHKPWRFDFVKFWKKYGVPEK